MIGEEGLGGFLDDDDDDEVGATRMASGQEQFEIL